MDLCRCCDGELVYFIKMTQKQKTQLEDALTAAYQRYARELAARAASKVRDPMMGEDLVQDTFVKTWVYLVKGGKIKMMKAFLYHILNNLIVDEYRKHKTFSLDVLLEKGFEPSDNQTGRLFNMLDGKAALSSIQRLPRKYKKVMRMRYAQGLSLREMSLLSGQSKNTMAVQAHRGLEKLRLLQGAA